MTPEVELTYKRLIEAVNQLEKLGEDLQSQGGETLVTGRSASVIWNPNIQKWILEVI